MFDAIFIILLLFPSMLGLAELMHLARVYIIFPKVKPEKTVVVYLSGERSLEQLQYVLSEYAWHGEKYAQKIAAVDRGIPENLIDECKRIADKNNIVFYSKDNFIN